MRSMLRSQAHAWKEGPLDMYLQKSRINVSLLTFPEEARIAGFLQRKEVLEMGLQRFAKKKIHYDFPCFVASFISLFILVDLGSQLLGG
jgi:hypothetical protein